MNRLIILTLFLGISSCSVQSDFCNYVEVEDESQFVGEWLKYSSAKKHDILKKEECNNLDQMLDNGNGEKTGKVRWANCLAGPDCNEAGMY